MQLADVDDARCSPAEAYGRDVFSASAWPSRNASPTQVAASEASYTCSETLRSSSNKGNLQPPGVDDVRTSSTEAPGAGAASVTTPAPAPSSSCAAANCLAAFGAVRRSRCPPRRSAGTGRDACLRSRAGAGGEQAQRWYCHLASARHGQRAQAPPPQEACSSSRAWSACDTGGGGFTTAVSC
jgi:hypothetical protein